MEAASLPRAHRRRRRRRPSWKAQAAVLLYAGALFAGWTIVEGSTALGTAPEPATAVPTTSGPLAPTSADLALGAIASRTARSVVTVGESAGFVGWRAKALTLVVTARPPGGWETGPGRSVTVTAGSRELEGTLVRADSRTGLGLVRVRGEIAPALWQQRRPAQVQAGDRLVAVTPQAPTIFAATEARHAAIWGLGGRSIPGAPVFGESGRIVGVSTGSRVVPIGRACGTIRRC